MAVIYPQKNIPNQGVLKKLLPDLSSGLLNITNLIEKHNIRIVKEEMEYGMSGYIEKRKEGWVIGINKYDSPNRQNFTLAHELGHYYLHKHQLMNKKHEDLILLRDNEYTPMEREANEFAANLLMPEEKFRNFINSGTNQVKDLAEKFNVSINAIRYRAYKLGYISRV